MTRAITRRYQDPLDVLWIGCARAIGFTVVRTPEVFASTDGKGTLLVGTPETLDPDDCLAQMILHELCHALVEGEASLTKEDWGLRNTSDDDLAREYACLRLQRHLLEPHGLHMVLAPTTEHRAFYDGLTSAFGELSATAPFTLELTTERRAAVASSRRAAQDATARAEASPFGPHLGLALRHTRALIDSATAFGAAPEDLFSDVH